MRKRFAIATAKGETPDVVLILEVKPGATVTDLKRLAEFATPPQGCTSMTFSPDGKRLVGLCPTGKQGGEATDCKIVVWNSDGKIERTIDSPKVSQQGSRLTFAVSNELIAL